MSIAAAKAFSLNDLGYTPYPAGGVTPLVAKQPPSSNTGEKGEEGKASPSIEKGERLAIIDTLTVVFPDSEFWTTHSEREESEYHTLAHRVQRYMLNRCNLIIDPLVRGGRNGYSHHFRIETKTGQQAGFLAVGGNNFTVCVYLSGEGCSQVGEKGFRHIKNCMETLKGHITRIDLAHDALNGEITINQVMNWYSHDLFRVSDKGAYPSDRLIDDRGHNTGKTYYVGSRESGKYFRAYEKGKQLGDAASKWVRLELELKRSKREIPLEAITSPTAYLAGAYRCLQFLSTTQCRIETARKTVQVSYQHLLKYAKLAYGRFVKVMHDHLEEPQKVIEALIREDGCPRRLNTATIAPVI